MKRIEILRSVMISGEPAPAGSFVEVGESDALLLIGMGKAALAAEPEEPPAPAEAPKRGRKATQTTSPEEE